MKAKNKEHIIRTQNQIQKKIKKQTKITNINELEQQVINNV